MNSSTPVQRITNHLPILSPLIKLETNTSTQFCLINVRALATELKRASLWDFYLINSVVLLFLTQIWLNKPFDNICFSLFGQIEVQYCKNRQISRLVDVAMLTKHSLRSHFLQL